MKPLPTSLVALLGLTRAGCVGKVTTAPCLQPSVPYESGDTGVGPCLEPTVPYESGDTGGGSGSGGTGLPGDTGALGAREQVSERVFASGRLPDDVVQRLSAPRKV